MRGKQAKKKKKKNCNNLLLVVRYLFCGYADLKRLRTTDLDTFSSNDIWCTYYTILISTTLLVNILNTYIERGLMCLKYVMVCY